MWRLARNVGLIGGGVGLVLLAVSALRTGRAPYAIGVATLVAGVLSLTMFMLPLPQCRWSPTWQSSCH